MGLRWRSTRIGAVALRAAAIAILVAAPSHFASGQSIRLKDGRILTGRILRTSGVIDKIDIEVVESGKGASRPILIVDDDESLVELLKEAFERDGRFDIRTTNNGFDAGMLVKELRPDIVLLDVMLPDINGKEVCQRVRTDKALDDVKIVCISGMVEADKVADIRAAGANDFIQKPFDIDRLVDRVCELLELEVTTTTG